MNEAASRLFDASGFGIRIRIWRGQRPQVARLVNTQYIQQHLASTWFERTPHPFGFRLGVDKGSKCCENSCFKSSTVVNKRFGLGFGRAKREAPRVFVMSYFKIASAAEHLVYLSTSYFSRPMRSAEAGRLETQAVSYRQSNPTCFTRLID